MSISIREIPKEDRPEIGRRIYEARMAPMIWRDAVRLALGRNDIWETEASAVAQTIARDYTLRAGKAWPPNCALSRDRIKEARAARKRKRDWLILTDGPARFTDKLPATA